MALVFDTKAKEESITIDGEELILRQPSAQAGFNWRNARQDKVKRDDDGKPTEIGNLEECDALLVSECIFNLDGTQRFTETEVRTWSDPTFLSIKKVLDEWKKESDPKKSQSGTPTG